jgi:hypothetical protein
VPHFSKELQFLTLGNICPHDRLKSLGILFLVLLDESFGFGVGVTVEEGTVDVADVAVAMGADYLDEFESVAFFSGLSHQSHQLLHVLIVVVGRVNLVDLCLNVGQLVILFSKCLPGGVIFGLVH